MWISTRAQKLKRVSDGLIIDLLRSLRLVEQELGVRVVAKAGEVHRRPHQIAGELVQTLGVLGITDLLAAGASLDGNPPLSLESGAPEGFPNPRTTGSRPAR